MYEKLSGMTGTAETEAEEFLKIYNMDVIVIPTNRKVSRDDYPDQIYKNTKAKYNAILKEIKEQHGKGRPILVGTITVEISEQISKILTREKILHNVLNAKNHASEAEIIAQSGQSGKVTIATNMAGRGTDIILGGNPNYQAERYLENMVDKKWIKELPVQLYIRFVFDNDITRALQAVEGVAGLEDLKKENINTLQRIYTCGKEHKRVVDLGGLHVLGTERHEPGGLTTSFGAVQAGRETPVLQGFFCVWMMIFYGFSVPTALPPGWSGRGFRKMNPLNINGLPKALRKLKSGWKLETLRCENTF